MQAVLLAAGNSTRFHPFGQKHKSTFKILGKPLIQWTIESLVAKEVTEVVVVCSKSNGVEECLRNLSFAIPIHKVFSEGARGAGETLLDAREVLSDRFLLLNAHQVSAGKHAARLLQKISKDVAAVLVKKEADLSAYGAVKLEGDKVIKLVEKPADPENYEYRIVGFYGLNKNFIEVLGKRKKHHYSLEDALSEVAESGLLRAVVTQKEDVVTLKYPFHLLGVLDYLLGTFEGKISEEASIDSLAKISGKVIIEEGVRILENAVVKGPVYIGRGSFIGNNAVVRGGVSLGENTVIGTNTEIKHSLLSNDSSIHSGFLGDSVVGENVKIAAFFVSGNVRLDRKNVSVVVKEKPVNSGTRDLGVMIGDNARLGIRVSTMPGVIIGRNSVIGPQTVVFKNVQDDTSFYSKFAETIVKEPSINVSEKEEKVVLFDIDYTLFDTATFKNSNLTEYMLYEEVVETLEALSGIVRLGIFSEGNLDFQKTKLLKTLINDRFAREHVHIVESKKATVSQVISLYKKHKLILVDDKLEMLKEAKEISDNVFTVWVKRGPFAKAVKNQSFRPDKSVDSLTEVIEIVSNYI